LRAELESERDWKRIYDSARFSAVFTAQYAPYWWGAFKQQRGEIKDYLELGSWEGQSAVLAGWLFPQARVTAVDWFANSDANARFDHNTAPLSGRLEKIKGTTYDVLSRFATEGRRFDVIYIDADHQFDAVMMDTILSWQLLRVGGYLIWDDYLSDPLNAPMFRTRLAIDAWLASRSPFVEPIFAGHQVCIRKKGAEPRETDMAYMSAAERTRQWSVAQRRRW
jgi:predicted O-methyltransferase YrrM